MTKELEKVCEQKAWEKFKENNDPIGQAKLYYKDNGEYFKLGFKAAIQSEQVQGLLKEIEKLGDSTIELWPSDLYDWATHALEKFRGGE